MRGRSSWPRFLFLSATSWTMLAVLTNGASVVWCPASNRSPEEQCSTPVPHHAAGGRLSSLKVRRRESRARSLSEQTGSGMDPPVFWAGNTGKSQTTHSIIHEPMSERNPENRPFRTRVAPKSFTTPNRTRSRTNGRATVISTLRPRRPNFRHKPRVRTRRSRSILRSTISSYRATRCGAGPPGATVAPVPGARRRGQGEFVLFDQLDLQLVPAAPGH